MVFFETKHYFVLKNDFICSLTFEEDDWEVSNMMDEYFASFAYSGFPSSETYIKWPKFLSKVKFVCE